MINKNKKSSFFLRTQNYIVRQNVVKYVFLILLLLFVTRIVVINKIDAGDVSIQEKANSQTTKQFKQNARRGDILDRNDEVIASNITLKKINLDPTLIQLEFIEKLANSLQMPKDELEKQIKDKLKKKQGRRNLIIKDNLQLVNSVIVENIENLKKQKLLICKTKEVKNKFDFLKKPLIFLDFVQEEKKIVKSCKREKIQGVAIQKYNIRYYPKKESLAPLVGNVNVNKKGISGIEREFEDVLAGKNGITTIDFNKDLKESYFNPKVVKKVEHGKNIKLTIDSQIQFWTYQAVKSSVIKHDADSAAAIVLKPNGEILAIANYPSDDPNKKTEYKAENYRNRALSDKVEPGSVMKPFTILLALDKNKITANDDELIDVTKDIGHIKFDNKYEHMTVKQILQKSHNLGTVNISERIDKEDMYNTWDKLGFGHPLGLMPNVESLGSLKHFSSWSNEDKRTLSFGHGPMNANLAQLAKSYLVFANQGSLPNLKLIYNSYTENSTKKIFSKKATKKIVELLDSVVSNDGSGYRAQIDNYNVAGKTGTAEMIIDGVYSKDGANRAFFIGFVPTQKPEYIMAVLINYPKKCYTFWDPTIRNKCLGSNSAPMVFKETMKNILNNNQAKAVYY